MLLNDLPKNIVIFDYETIATLLHINRSNRNLSVFVGITENYAVMTLSATKSTYLDFSDREWAGDGLETVQTKSRDKNLARTAADMVDGCIANGIDPYSSIVVPKINLAALARLNDGCIVSTDNRISEISMRKICLSFNIPFVDINDIDI